MLSTKNVCGFAEFQKIVCQDLKKCGEEFDREKLLKATSFRWELMSKETKEEWNEKARQRKLEIREKLTTILNNASMQPLPTCFAKDILGRKPPAVGKSKLKEREEKILAANPDKLRKKERNDLLISLEWKTQHDKNGIKDEKFYFISHQLLVKDIRGECIPVEISCVEFTLNAGVTKNFCTIVKPPENLDLDEAGEAELLRRSSQYHRLSFEEVQYIGKTADEVLAELMNFCEISDVKNLRQTRLYTLDEDYDEMMKVLAYLVKAAKTVDVNQKDIQEVIVRLDDLTFGLFNIFDVDYLLHSPTGDIIFAYFYFLVDGSKYNWHCCAIHDDYWDPPIFCCQSKQHLIVEMIRRSVQMQKLDIPSLKQYATRRDPLRMHYYSPMAFDRVVQEPEPTNATEHQPVASVVQCVDQATGGVVPETDQRLKDLENSLTATLAAFDGNLEKLEKFVSENMKKLKVSAPNTMSVIRLLPRTSRGVGRGIFHLEQGQEVKDFSMVRRKC